ncbi:HamA C-terminal domain-containing protein [Archangium violaceum]|uniref:HamA C-terminal domain-containing protein n=1 Tax=Archangium violaceum TaxID=83451 RepID=UPI000A05E1E6|nr:DUF1837 domain-containing protein [Archangium violaceum]
MQAPTQDAAQTTLALAGVYTGLEARLKEVVYTWDANGIRATGRFFYLAFQNGKPTLEEFVNFIYWKIIPFCITRRERMEKQSLFIATNDERYIHELTDKARNLFAKAIKSQKTSGEPGELILFILLEGFLKAPQLVSKMYLKTNENVPVHGTDSIHVQWDAEQNSLVLYWGESKLYAVLSSALDSILDSIEEFLGHDADRPPRERDIDVLHDHANISDPKIKAALLEYFDPYSEKANQRKEVYACFVGFDFDKFDGLMGLSDSDARQKFESEFLFRIKSACELFCGKIVNRGLDELEFILFLLPFPDVEELRKAFFKRLGMSDA